MKRSSPAVTVLKIVVLLIVAWFMGLAVSRDWETIRAYEWRISAVPFAVSTALFFAAYALLARLWGRVLKLFGTPISYRGAWRMYFIGNLGRYIPGKIWTVAGMAYMGARYGIPATVSAAAAVFAQACSLLSSFVFFALFLILWHSQITGAWIAGAVIGASLLVGVFMFPRNLERAMNALLTRLGREPVTLPFSTGDVILLTAQYAITWLLFGGAFWFFIRSVGAGLQVGYLYGTAAYAVAYVTGFVAFFVPGGIGIREGILGFLLGSVMPVGVALVVAVSSRLLVTVIELFCVLLTLMGRGEIDGEKEAHT